MRKISVLLILVVIMFSFFVSCDSTKHPPRYYTEGSMLYDVSYYKVNEKIDIPERVVSMSFGVSESVFAITESGKVYCWGNNVYGQLGLGHKEPVPEPTLHPYLENISAIAASLYHTVSLTKDGIVYGFGGNEFGQLSTAEAEYLMPHTIEGLNDIVEIAASVGNSYALTRQGTILCLGDNEVNQLGIKKIPATNTPLEAPIDAQIVQISADRFSVMAMDTEQNVWVFGHDYLGQLGTKKGYGTIIDVPEISKNKVKAKKVLVSYTYGLMQTVTDELYIVGLRQPDKLMFSEYEWKKTGLSSFSVRDFDAYLQLIAAKSEQGDLIVWGCSRIPGSIFVEGWQGFGNFDNMEKIHAIAIAHEDEYTDFFVNDEGVYIINPQGELYLIWQNIECEE